MGATPTDNLDRIVDLCNQQRPVARSSPAATFLRGEQGRRRSTAGYLPVDNAERYAAQITGSARPIDAAAPQGGAYARVEYSLRHVVTPSPPR